MLERSGPEVAAGGGPGPVAAAVDGQRASILPDFFIGAHAAVLGLKLLTRDAARYRSYFPPSTSSRLLDLAFEAYCPECVERRSSSLLGQIPSVPQRTSQGRRLIRVWWWDDRLGWWSMVETAVLSASRTQR
jgi:hypothetical protein